MEYDPEEGCLTMESSQLDDWDADEDLLDLEDEEDLFDEDLDEGDLFDDEWGP